MSEIVLGEVGGNNRIKTWQAWRNLSKLKLPVVPEKLTCLVLFHIFKSSYLHRAKWIKKIWVKLFKNGSSKIFGRQSLKNLKWYGLPRQNISLQIFWRLSFTNFTWSILEYLDPYVLTCKKLTINPSRSWANLVRTIFFSRKTNIFYPMISKHKYAYQGVRNASFSENFAYVQNEWFSLLKFWGM